jgi:glucoamylase
LVSIRYLERVCPAEDADVAKFLIEMADIFNEGIERWIYIQNTELSKMVGVDSYYVRITPSDVASTNSPAKDFVPIKNRSSGNILAPATRIISVDASALVSAKLRKKTYDFCRKITWENVGKEYNLFSVRF